MQLQLLNLSKTYLDAGRELQILQSLNHTFETNSKVAIIGRSGVGKSTLLHILGGLDRATGGSILFGGTDLSALSEEELSAFRGSNVGFVFQFHHLMPEFSALENVSMPLLIAGVPEDEAQQKAHALLERVDLAGRITHRPSQLSGGEQQRVAIARAVVNNPQLILADEPTGNLDASTAAGVQELLQEIQAELKSLLIIVTHNPELARTMEQVLEMGQGGELSNITV
ncbi:MAG: lipoprotein-releasing system ATP-binding protein LolD [Proteobacteria bacterium]|nr:MAG: lipoprotein-releasing system ATP-binding protein LolD [Pseudomonadota bacterium]